VELKGPVHHGVVGIAPALIEIPGEKGVKTLVVVEGPTPQVIEPEAEAQDRKPSIRPDLRGRSPDEPG
jgi:hypothetical protein